MSILSHVVAFSFITEIFIAFLLAYRSNPKSDRFRQVWLSLHGIYLCILFFLVNLNIFSDFCTFSSAASSSSSWVSLSSGNGGHLLSSSCVETVSSTASGPAFHEPLVYVIPLLNNNPIISLDLTQILEHSIILQLFNHSISAYSCFYYFCHVIFPLTRKLPIIGPWMNPISLIGSSFVFLVQGKFFFKHVLLSGKNLCMLSTVMFALNTYLLKVSLGHARRWWNKPKVE